MKYCTLSLNSPLKANWFSGFPSGTLYLLNQSTVASRYPGFSRLTSSISAKTHHGETLHFWHHKQTCVFQAAPTVKISGFWVLSIDYDDLPVCFPLINQSQSPQHLHFDDFSSRAHLKIAFLGLKADASSAVWRRHFIMFPHLVSYVTNIDGIVVSNTSCVTVLVVGVLPRLFEKKNRKLNQKLNLMSQLSLEIRLSCGMAP